MYHGIFGVYKNHDLYEAKFSYLDKNYDLVFNTPEEAIIQRLIWEIKYLKEKAPNYIIIKRKYPQLLYLYDNNIDINQNITIVTKIINKLRKDKHCPCKIDKTEDTVCMCREFREQDGGYCHCGLYHKL